jgi:hypothetical protein
MIKTRTIDGKEIIIMPVDWKKTRERGKKIYHMNFHTDGYRFKWRWFVKQARFKFSKYWVFKPSRVTSRKIAEYVLKPNSDYRHIYREWHLM